MKRRFLARRRAKSHSTEISLTPLIDTALTLLIIFMVTSPMMHNSIKINLPEGKTKESAATAQELVVYITDKGHMFFNGLPVTDENLIPTIKKTMELKDKQQPVFVKADTKVNYGKVIQVVDQIKMVGGIEYVALATKKA